MKMNYFDASGATQEIDVEADIYKQASDARLTVPQLLGQKYPTDAKRFGSTFEQLMASTGLYQRVDDAYGIRPRTMDQVLGTEKLSAGTIVREATPASRIIFPAVFLEAVENKLKADTASYVATFDSLVAVNDSIAGARFEQPVLNYSKPEAARSQAIAQLAMPNAMLNITISDVARRIPTYSLGLEISFEALKSTTLDLVSLAVARQAEVERASRVDGYIGAFLNGDPDVEMLALTQVKANTFDATITTAGALTHKAWVSWLRKNYRKRHIDWVICDLAAALAIENRTGKPVITTDNPNSARIDALAQVANPQWQGVKIFLLEDGVIPANTIIGIDSRYAIRRVRNSQADYAAVEQFVLKKSEAMRYDFGEVAYRLFDDAWEVLSLTP
jgi:hypothetical protein